MIKRILFSVLISASLFSCTTSGGLNGDSTGGGGSTTTAAMVTRVDNVVYEMPPQYGGNLADATGGMFGNNYFLLNGYKNINSLKAKVGSTIYNVNIAIPKSDLTLGQHPFSSNLVAGGYYADFDITGPVPAVTVNTTSGYINVTSYNSTTKEMKGNFSFYTNDGVDLVTHSHTLTGTFDFILN